jgi:hypothetical protein
MRLPDLCTLYGTSMMVHFSKRFSYEDLRRINALVVPHREGIASRCPCAEGCR